MRKLSLVAFVGLFGFVAPSGAQALFKVPGTHTTIQDAVDACPTTGCVITLSDPLYKLSNTLYIHEKTNLTIKGAAGIKPVIQFQDSGNRAGPSVDAADAAQKPAGWKQWPLNNTTALGGSQNTTNPNSPSGYQHNGVILIEQSQKITIDNVVIDGVSPLPIGHVNIWMPAGNPTLLGNFGLNLFLSKEVDVKNTKIQNCFAGMYIYGRNKGGAMARNNAADLDKAALLPNSQFGYTGQHTVEYSELANNIWGVYVESDWDLGSTFHHNLIYNNYNKDYSAWITATKASSSPTSAIAGNSEAANHPGGFLYGKDFVTVPYKIYNNTFYQNAAIFGYGMWRATTQHLFYNNLITNPYFDYNSDKSSLLTANFKTYFLQQDLMSKYSDGIYNNTFSIFPAKASLDATPSATPVVLTRQNSVFPMPRLDLQLQTQKKQINFSNTAYTPPGATTSSYIKLAAPVVDTGLYWSGVSIQYQANDRHFPYQWTLSGPTVPASIPTKTYTSLYTLKGVVAAQTNLPAGVNVGDTIPVDDQPNSQTWKALDSSIVLNLQQTFTDTLGVVLKVGTKDISSQTNWFIKSVPFQSTNPTSPKFLEPVWTDPGVDSVILDHGRWGIDPDGSIVDVGAKSKVKGTPPSINLVDGTQAKYDSVAQTIRFSFDLQELGGNFTSYKYYLFTYASSVSDDDTPILPYNPTNLPLTSIISGVPKVGPNSFEAKLANKPDARSRYQVMVVATTATGATVYSNMGTWLYKNDGFDMNVLFYDPVTMQQVTSTRVGQKVIMRVRPVISRDKTIPVVDYVHYFCFDSTSGSLKFPTPSLDTIKAKCKGPKQQIRPDTAWKDSLVAGNRTANVYTGTLQIVQIRASGLHDLANGGRVVDPTDIFRTNVVGEKDYEVVFTTAGPQIVGANGKDTVGVGGKKATFSGDGKILVRPGLPYLAQFQDPPSIRLADTGFIPKEARYQVKIAVFDSMGNQVDTSSDISLETTSPTGGISALGADPTAKTMVLHLDSATGMFLARTHDPVGSIFWLKSKIVVRDSARVKVTPPKESLKWTYAAGDSIFRYLGQTAKINLALLDGSGNPATSASAPAFVAHFTPGTGLKIALASKPDSTLDSVLIDRTGTAVSVDLIISADAPVTDAILSAFNSDLNDPADFQPVNFREPPIPPYPTMDSAALLDSDCDGALDEIRVYFKPDPVRRLKDSVLVNDVVANVSTGKQVILAAGVKVVDKDSSVVSIKLASPIPGSAPAGSVSVHLKLKRMSLGDTVVTATVRGRAGDTILSGDDRIGPQVKPQALIWENLTGKPKDTLRVVLSEPVSYSGSTFPLLYKNGATWAKSTAIVTSNWYGATRDTLFLEVTGNKGELAEHTVVRLDPDGGVVDIANNVAGDCANATDTLQAYVKPVPMLSSYLVDANGDGAADKVVVKFAAKLSKPAHFPDSLVVADWCASCAAISIPKALLTTSDSVSFEAPVVLPKGTTRGTGASGEGQLTFKNRMQVQQIPMVDSVGPIPTFASIRFGKSTDTLQVTFSEPLSEVSAASYLIHESGTALTLAKLAGNATGDQWTFLVDTSAKPSLGVGDSIYLPNSGSKLVAANTGTKPTSVAHPPRVVVQGGDRIPDSAIVLDKNGDGTADAVRLVYRKPLKGKPTFTFTWGGGTVLADSTAYQNLVSGNATFEIPVTGFPAGITAGPGQATSTSFVGGVSVGTLGFDLIDGVAPVLDSVFVSYGLAEGSPDTILLIASEPLAAGTNLSGLAWINRKGTVLPFAARDPKATAQISGNRIVVVCDSCVDNINVSWGLPGEGDYARLAKGVQDDHSVAVGDSSRWVRVYNGPHPIRYNVDVYPKAVHEDDGTKDDAPLRKLPAVTSWIVPPPGSKQVFAPIGEKTMEGLAGVSGAANLGEDEFASGLFGVRVKMNTSFDGQFLVYDNMGVFVGRVDLKISLDSMRAAGMLDNSGRFTLVVALNGSSSTGKPLGSGVYMIRMIGYSEQVVNGQKLRLMIQNKIFKIGNKRKAAK